MTRKFDTEKQVVDCIAYIQEYFKNYSNNADGVAVNVSGGKDSSVALALCVRALGTSRVWACNFPLETEILDIDGWVTICKTLAIENTHGYNIDKLSDVYHENTGYMSYASPQSVNGLRNQLIHLYAKNHNLRVCGNTNASKLYMGSYFKPQLSCHFDILKHYTTSEVVKIGEFLGVPSSILERSIMYKSNCGWISQSEIDEFVRNGFIQDRDKILELIRINKKVVLDANSFDFVPEIYE